MSHAKQPAPAFPGFHRVCGPACVLRALSLPLDCASHRGATYEPERSRSSATARISRLTRLVSMAPSQDPTRLWQDQVDETLGSLGTLLRIVLLSAASAVASVVFASIVLAFGTLPLGSSIDTVQERFWNLALSVFLMSGPVTILLLILARHDRRPQWDTAFALSALASTPLLALGFWFVWPMWGDLLVGTTWALVLGVVGTTAHAAALRFEAISFPVTPPQDS